MNIADLQTALNARGQKPALIVDGVPGRKTMVAIDAVLEADKDLDSRFEDWSDARRQIAFEQIIYRDLGIEVGAIDGLVGEQTRYARTIYAGRGGRSQINPALEAWRDTEAGKPSLAPTPMKAATWPTQARVREVFGEPGSHQVPLEFPYPMRLAWEPTTSVFRASCHKLVLKPMQRIWKRTLDHYGHEQLKKLRLDMFGGCLNIRKMRGGSAMSMHSWGIAVDIDPDRNQLKWGRDKASLDDPVYGPFWRFVEDEGAISLGRARNYDWMHFQFARL